MLTLPPKHPIIATMNTVLIILGVLIGAALLCFIIFMGVTLWANAVVHKDLEEGYDDSFTTLGLPRR